MTLKATDLKVGDIIEFDSPFDPSLKGVRMRVLAVQKELGEVDTVDLDGPQKGTGRCLYNQRQLDRFIRLKLRPGDVVERTTCHNEGMRVGSRGVVEEMKFGHREPWPVVNGYPQDPQFLKLIIEEENNMEYERYKHDWKVGDTAYIVKDAGYFSKGDTFKVTVVSSHYVHAGPLHTATSLKDVAPVLKGKEIKLLPDWESFKLARVFPINGCLHGSEIPANNGTDNRQHYAIVGVAKDDKNVEAEKRIEAAQAKIEEAQRELEAAKAELNS